MSSSLHSLRRRLSDKNLPRLKNKSMTEIPLSPGRPSSPLAGERKRSAEDIQPISPREKTPPKKTPPAPPPRRGTICVTTDVAKEESQKPKEKSNSHSIGISLPNISPSRLLSPRKSHENLECSSAPSSPRYNSPIENNDNSVQESESPEKLVWTRNPEAERIRQMLLEDSSPSTDGPPSGSPILRRNTVTLEPTNSPFVSPRLKHLQDDKKDKTHIIKNVSDRLFSLRDSIPLGSRTTKEQMFEITRSDNENQAGLDNLGKEFEQFSNKPDQVPNLENEDEISIAGKNTKNIKVDK